MSEHGQKRAPSGFFIFYFIYKCIQAGSFRDSDQTGFGQHKNIMSAITTTAKHSLRRSPTSKHHLFPFALSWRSGLWRLDDTFCFFILDSEKRGWPIGCRFRGHREWKPIRTLAFFSLVLIPSQGCEDLRDNGKKRSARDSAQLKVLFIRRGRGLRDLYNWNWYQGEWNLAHSNKHNQYSTQYRAWGTHFTLH